MSRFSKAYFCISREGLVREAKNRQSINMNGVIKKITDKGFGFITSPELSKDLFFHSNSLVDVAFNDLREGDKVSFETEDSPKGMNAVDVKRA